MPIIIPNVEHQEAVENFDIELKKCTTGKNSMEDLQSYKDKLSEAAKTSSKRMFPNGDEEHAAMAFSVLFNNTKSSIKIVADNFSGEISNDENYTTALEDCLKRNVKVEALVLNQPGNKSEGYKLLEKYRAEGKNITIKLASPEAIAVIASIAKYSLTDLKELYNFSIFDDDKYRIEFLPKEFRALVSFNNKKLATQYSTLFDIAFKRTELIPA